jgi:hypothetical protein
MSSEIWKCKRLEIFHGSIRFPTNCSRSRWAYILRSRRLNILRQLKLTFLGLSPTATTLDQIRVLKRFKEIRNESSALCDLIWSELEPERDMGIEKNSK